MRNEHRHLFSTGQIGAKSIRNRFVSQAMEGNDGNADGSVSERTLERYRKLARGRWGIIVVEALTVSPSSKSRINQMVINRANLDSFRRLVAEMKAEDPEVTVLFQITHAGRKAGRDFSGPTALYDPADHEHLLTTDEVGDIKNAIIEGVCLAEEAGADGVDFKMCHGYFGCEMLRPANIRDDRWGGSFGNRTRFIRESVEELRVRLKNRAFIMGSRLSVYEGIRGGCGTAGPGEILEDLDEMARVITLLDTLGMDYVNVSAGIPGSTSEITRPTPKALYLYLHQMRYARWARGVLGESDVRVIGSAYSILKDEALVQGNENIEKGYTDFIGWGRQSFADPLFPGKVERGEDVDYCTGCSGCSRLMIAQMNDGCLLYNDYYRNLWKNRNQ